MLSVEGQNGDMMMRWEEKEAGGEGGGSFSDTQTDFSGFSWVASGLESVIF